MLLQKYKLEKKDHVQTHQHTTHHPRSAKICSSVQ